MYNFGYPNTYAQPQYYPNHQQNQNILPQQQIIQVNGKSSVDTIQLAPNSSVLLMDTSAPIVWMCVSDGVGKVNSVPYDISEHKDAPPVDVMGLEERIKRLEDRINAQSNAGWTEPKQTDAERIPD